MGGIGSILCFHRIMEWFGFKGTLKTILFQPLPWSGTPSTIAEVAVNKDNGKLLEKEELLKNFQFLLSRAYLYINISPNLRNLGYL